MASLISATLDVSVNRIQYDKAPPHHVTSTPTQTWSSYFSSWTSTAADAGQKKTGSRSSSKERKDNLGRNSSSKDLYGDNKRRIGFRNPWPSWYKPTQKQVWDALEWGDDQDPCIELAISRVRDTNQSLNDKKKGGIRRVKSMNANRTRLQFAAELLRVQEPDFGFDHEQHRAKTTWLGHAGVLVQLPPLQAGGRPVRCLFDPIFSNRSSPSQMAGPIRSYPSPCKVESLPPIDIFMMSHNHHDHLDYDTIISLWKCNKGHIRFLVPLGNKAWFVGSGIDEERVIELDWWDSVNFSQSGSEPLKITCTPCQHNSGRTGLDANETLWSSWYLEHPYPDPYRIYFAGDTGFQFHAASVWPPEPKISDGEIDMSKVDRREKDPYPSCPAFQEIADKLGPPDLLYLPVSVGATFSFLRSYVPLPNTVHPFPRHKLGLTGHNHLIPWDAVHVFNLMTAKHERRDERKPVAIAMHWGTFVPERSEVLKTLGQLEYACKQLDVEFGRSLNEVEGKSPNRVFLAINHGQSVTT